jgi:hypothetical protein
VDEAVLVDADIDEGTEGGDVGDDAGELHADLEVGRFFDAFLEGEELELFARVAAGLGEFGEDVLSVGRPTSVADVFLEVDLLAGGVVGEQSSTLQPTSAAIFSTRGSVPGGRRRSRADARRRGRGGSRRLVRRLFAEARDFLELRAGGEGAVFIAEGDDVFGERWS